MCVHTFLKTFWAEISKIISSKKMILGTNISKFAKFGRTSLYYFKWPQVTAYVFLNSNDLF
jgi:hypothetical protein